jgi:hypothetical protein
MACRLSHKQRQYVTWAGLKTRGDDRANIRRTTSYNLRVARCRVSFTDPEGILHAVEVDVDSLYEAVAHAVAEFRAAAPIKRAPGPTTEFTVTVYRKPVEHRIRLTQVERWAEHTTKEGPSGITKRERVRKLLGPTC